MHKEVQRFQSRVEKIYCQQQDSEACQSNLLKAFVRAVTQPKNKPHVPQMTTVIAELVDSAVLAKTLVPLTSNVSNQTVEYLIFFYVDTWSAEVLVEIMRLVSQFRYDLLESILGKVAIIANQYDDLQQLLKEPGTA